MRQWTEDEKTALRRAYNIINVADLEVEDNDEGMDVERLLGIASYILFMLLMRTDLGFKRDNSE